MVKNNLEKTFAKAEQKKRGAGAPKPKAERDPKRLGTIIGIGLGLILSLNLCVYLHRTQIESSRMDRLDELADQRTALAADVAEKYIAMIWQEIRAISQRPTLVEALALGDEEKIAQASRAITRRIEGLRAVRFVEPGDTELDPEGDLPIRFTELEMIRKALDREPVFPEAVKVNNEWAINFITPIPADPDQEVIAVMLLALAVDDLAARVSENRVAIGRMVLQQRFATTKPIEVFSVGKGDVGDWSYHPVDNSYWQIGFMPSYVLLEQAQVDAKIVYGVMVLASALIVYLGFFSGRLVGLRIKARREAEPVSAPTVDKASSALPASFPQVDVLDVEIAEADEALLGLEEVGSRGDASPQTEASEDVLDIQDLASIPEVVFRAYDIRGIAKEQITPELAQQVGQALGSEALDNGQDTLIVARDARLTSPELTEFLIRGILSSGCHVLNIGTVPTPLMYFAAATLKESQSGVMVTASHNGAQYNGFKIVMNGKSRSGEDIKAIRNRILRKDLYEGQGEEQRHDVVADYIDTIFADVALAGDISIVIDAANGVTGLVAPRLFEELGCHVTPLFCDLDGNFPNHPPDTSVVSHLDALIAKVKETHADLGVAFDGDGDRLIVVSPSGQIIWPDRLLMLFAKDIVSRNPGADVVFDVKSTRHLINSVTSYGGRPIMWKTGHAPMKNKMLETGALIGGEYSGHIFIKDRWFGFDDGMYAAARLIEILSLHGGTLDEMFEEFPQSPSTPEIRVPVDENRKFAIVKALAEQGDFGEGRMTTIDGVRVDFPDGWGLVRASNTSGDLTLRFEADDQDALFKVKAIVAQQLKKVDSSIQIDWDKS